MVCEAPDLGDALGGGAESVGLPAAASGWRRGKRGAALLLGLLHCPYVCLLGLLRRDESHLDQQGEPLGRALADTVGGATSGHGCAPAGTGIVFGESVIETNRRDKVGP